MSTYDRFPSCGVCGHLARGLFCGLAGDHLEVLDRTKVVRRYRRGEPVCEQGEPADTLYCIHSGVVELYKIGPRDEEIVIRLLRPGDMVGYRAMLADEAMAASARAVGDVTVCHIARSTLFEMLQAFPEMTLKLLSKLATELRVSEEELVARVAQSAPQRVARFLLWLMDGNGAGAGQPVDVRTPIRREDMAHVIGIAPETLSRVLHDLARRRIIRLEGRRIHVRDTTGLRSIADSALRT